VQHESVNITKNALGFHDLLNNLYTTKALTVNTSSSPSSASFWSVEEEVVEPKIKHTNRRHEPTDLHISCRL